MLFQILIIYLLLSFLDLLKNIFYISFKSLKFMIIRSSLIDFIQVKKRFKSANYQITHLLYIERRGNINCFFI